MIQVHERVSALVRRRLSMVEMLQHPTVAALAKYLGKDTADASQAPQQQQARDERAWKQLQAMQQQARWNKSGRGSR